jgi:hypothetical protein
MKIAKTRKSKPSKLKVSIVVMNSSFTNVFTKRYMYPVKLKKKIDRIPAPILEPSNIFDFLCTLFR